MFRTLLVVATALALTAELTAEVANVDAALPPGVRSGERVHWAPDEIGTLVRAIRAEGAGHVEAAELAQIVHSESRALHVDPLYALALIKIESNFRANAVSNHGAVGLLQVRPQAARSIAVVSREGSRPPTRAERLQDPRTNVAVGLRYLQQLERQFTDQTMALAAYNIGPSRVRQHLEHGRPVPRTYANRVLATYRAFAADRAATSVPTDG